MNKFVTGVLALAATSSVGLADPGDSSEWLELDSEINGLATSYSPSADGTGYAVLIRSTFTYSTDDISTGGGKDVSGFKFEDINMAFWGAYGDYSYRVSFDLDGSGYGGGIELEAAYADWDCGEYFTARMGSFKPHVLMSGSIAVEKQLFIDRTPLGAAFDRWDIGVGAMGTASMIDWSAALTNGANGQEEGHRYAIRGEYSMGTGAAMAEGALGANDDFNGTFGATYYSDDTTGNTGTRGGSLFLFDVHGTAGPIGFGGEIAFVSEDLAGDLNTGQDFGRGSAFPLSFGDGTDDTNPFSLWGSYLLNQEFEGGLRYDMLDSEDDVNVISVVLNWYLSGHNAKWQGQISNYDSDGADGVIFQIGLVVGSMGL